MFDAANQYARLRDEQFSLFEQYARKHGMNSKCLMVFLWIYNNPSGLTQEMITKRTFSTKQVVQAIIKNYIQKDWLYLEQSQEDRRKKLVKMTDLGRECLRKLIEPLDSLERDAMSHLSAEEQTQLLKTTAVFSSHLKRLMEESVVSQFVE